MKRRGCLHSWSPAFSLLCFPSEKHDLLGGCISKQPPPLPGQHNISSQYWAEESCQYRQCRNLYCALSTPLESSVRHCLAFQSDVKEIRKKVKRYFLYLLKKHLGLVFQGRALAQDRDQDYSNLYVPKQVSRDCREKQTLQKPFAMQNSTNNCKLFELKQRNCLNGFWTLFLLPNNEHFLFCKHDPGMRSLIVWGYVHTGNIHVTFQITFLLFIRVLVIHLESRTNTMFVKWLNACYE